VAPAEPRQLARPIGGEPKSDNAVVTAVLDPADEARVGGTIDEAHRAVVPKHERRRNVADGRAAMIVRAAHREQELMLGGCDADCLGLLLAPVHEPAQLRAER
jgi:hypothetical protein